ncbi:Uncharacterised protein [Mycobacteroides abscessus subsp. abscessus]|nr:Uncharacterised protein [Mycobacteroides abscessus subsp. abscessus]
MPGCCEYGRSATNNWCCVRYSVTASTGNASRAITHAAYRVPG